MRIQIDKNVNPLSRFDDYWQPIGSLRTPRVALKSPYRKELAGQKLIKCPKCTELLIHIDRDTLVQVFSVNEKKKAYVPKVQYRKCFFCHEEVGVKIVG